MKKFFLLLLNILVLTSIGTTVYHFYLLELDSKLIVECDYNYIVDTNLVDVSCNIDDEDFIISSDYPLTLYLYDENELIVSEVILEDGSNTFELDDLDFNEAYSISVVGYNLISEVYTLVSFDEYEFSTSSEDIIPPSLTFTQTLLTDTEYHFSIEIIDIDDCATSVDITLYNSSDSEILTHNFTDFSNLILSLTELSSESDYYIEIEIYYITNDYDQTAIVLISKEFTTLNTLHIPSAEISGVSNDNINLTFNLVTFDHDATNVIYTVELIDLTSNILHSETTTQSNISLDVNEISGDYYISIKASYSFNGTIYNDIELAVYSVYNNALSNFFLLPTVSITNTDLPLTSYDDYDDYIFTYFNLGITDFTINCQAPVDCSELVLNPLYSDIPFEIVDFVHAYYDINVINFLYNSTELEFSISTEYSSNDIATVDQQVTTILNEIINETMTEYEKILAVHDYVVNNAAYDTTCSDNIALCDNDHTAIGIFVDELAVCEGYAHAIDIMLRALHIPTFKISSLTHQWNVVYYNGAWYHLDATWDDPVVTSGPDILSHDYFLITTAELLILDDSNSHTYSTTYLNFIE